MPFDIDADIVQQADKCEKGHRCLDAEEDFLCPVERVVIGEGDDFVFVRCAEGKTCPFMMSYGIKGYHACLCRVRIEIHKRYGK